MVTNLRILIFFVFLSTGAVVTAEDKGIIGKYQEDGFPVILKLVDEFPEQEIRQKYEWLTVISWKYDGSERNGMPPDDTNARMIKLEDEIDDLAENARLCRHAYSRTGNNLKEFVYYISDRDIFMQHFNDALASHPRYPVEIHFYEDKEWKDFKKILELFRKGE